MSAIPGIIRKPELIGVASGIFFMGINAAGIIGPPLLGVLVQSVGWINAGYAMVPIVALGIAFCWLTRFTD